MTTSLPYEVLALIVASMCLILTLLFSFALGVRYQIAFDRLPLAARDSELDARIGSKEARLLELEEELQRCRVALAERDQAEAEAEHWRATVETAKAEYAALGDQRREIEEVREQHRRALEELTLAETTLREVRADADRAREDAREATERAQAAEQRRNDFEAEAEAQRASLAGLEGSVAEADGCLRGLKEEHESVSADLKHGREELGVLKARRDDLDREVERMTSARALAEAELADLRREIEALPERRDEIDALSRKREALERAIDTGERRENRLQAHIARLQEELDACGEGGPADEERSLADLTKPPACLAVERVDGTFGPIYGAALRDEEERDALRRVMDHLRESGLQFSERTVSAFHTSLKSAVVSPLTVLAGISGTGKSQLPRYYAAAMGIHFLKISVQPRWDGPQDLFGFYNYIEKRYKATDLARALVHFDLYNWPSQAEKFRDRMLLVLLDEMNLARIEYYFSEFLSRLEGRPFKESLATENDRRPSEIDIDVSRRGQPKRVYAGQNILFVGTMNEDESTLTLSDKVLDRANVMRFPRPLSLKGSLPATSGHAAAAGYLTKRVWLDRWMRSAEKLPEEQRRRATSIIDRINGHMDELGRPFGHRMGQAMLHYVANYPSMAAGPDDADPVSFGLADQIEQRIMPKLMGIVVDNYRQPLQALADLTRMDLHDAEFATAIEAAVKRARETNGLFVWRGLTRKA